LKNIIPLFLLLLFSTKLISQNVWSNEYAQAYEEVLKLNFEKSDSILKSIKTKNKATEAYIKASSFFINVLLSNYEDYVLKNDSISHYLDIVNSANHNTAWIYYFEIEMLTMKSLINAKLNNKMSSAFNIYKASKLTKSSIDKYPDFSPIKTLHGFQLCTFSKIPDNYKTIASFFGIEGNYQDGIAEISESISNTTNSIIKNKSKFIYIFSQKEFGNKNNVSISTTIKNYTEYPVMIYYEAYLLYKNNNIEKAKEILLNNEKVWQNKMNYLNYFTGKLLAFSIDNSAKKYFSLFLSHTKTNTFKISTFRYLAYLELIEGDTTTYNSLITKIKQNNNNTHSDTDKSALNEIINNQKVTLIKTQLLYDGGNYKKAKETLLSKPKNEICNSENDFIIYYYRLGCIYLKLNNTERAINNFKHCTAFSFNNNFHYQANAFLHLGEIYILEDEIEKAKINLENCIKLKDFPYSYSIHNRAFFLLNTL
jgi:tetratricopeptide (TPR) repeat protein